jgi:hypothetical protein
MFIPLITHSRLACLISCIREYPGKRLVFQPGA